MEHPHPRLVRLLGYCNEGDNFCLVYEFMKGGSLQSLLENPEKLKKLTAKQRIQIAFDIGDFLFHFFYFHFFFFFFLASTINFLHSNGIFHLEIKPGNILLDENYRTFLADCGAAKLLLDGFYFYIFKMWLLIEFTTPQELLLKQAIFQILLVMFPQTLMFSVLGFLFFFVTVFYCF